MTSTTKAVLITVAGAVLVLGLVWYFGVYDTAQGKCNRGDMGACLVLAAQQAQQSANAAASQSASAAVASAEASASAAASASASASTEASAEAANFAASCQQLGGSLQRGGCWISYPSPADPGAGPGHGTVTRMFQIPLKADGTLAGFDNYVVASARTSCLLWNGPVGGGGAGGTEDYWHPDTHVCAIP